ncbi:hypothetical protein GCM10027590_02650 [Nocardiopsis nanhaiensis]
MRTRRTAPSQDNKEVPLPTTTKSSGLVLGTALLAVAAATAVGGAVLSAPAHAAGPAAQSADAQSEPYCVHEAIDDAPVHEAPGGEVIDYIPGGESVAARPAASTDWMEIANTGYVQERFLSDRDGPCVIP